MIPKTKSNDPNNKQKRHYHLELIRHTSSNVGQQPPPPQKTSKFKWWKLFTWPFICLGTLLTGCCECCCGSCCDSGSSSSLKEELAEEAVEKVVDSFFGD
ncbi:MAG: hypothetical protein HZR80_01115 [Candidatus Heimdallarchaeota archaeon]